jgi:ribonuclease J
LEIKKAHASGHVSQEDIKVIIEQADPKMVIPIHTEKPEMFKEICDSEVLVPEEGKNYEL